MILSRDAVPVAAPDTFKRQLKDFPHGTCILEHITFRHVPQRVGIKLIFWRVCFHMLDKLEAIWRISAVMLPYY